MKYFVIFLILVGTLGYALAFESSYTNYYSNPEFQTYSLVAENYRYAIPFDMSNGTLAKMEINCNTSKLVLQVEPTNDSGMLIIGLPRILIDSKFLNGNDDIFFVLENSGETQFTETVDAGLRILSIPFSENASKITIIGANYPESPKRSACNGTDNPPFSYLLSPLKQFKSGIESTQVICADGLKLMLKPTEFITPVCVTDSTYNELANRGWSVVLPFTGNYQNE